MREHYKEKNQYQNVEQDEDKDLKRDGDQDSKKTDKELFSSDSEDFFEAFEENEENEELKPNPFRKWIIRIVAFTLILALSANVLAVWPSVVNLPAIQFLKKSKELSDMEDIQRYKQAVVVIEVDNRRGTGFNITPDGIIVTNHHVVENGKDITVRFPNGKAFKAEVVNSHADQDLAVLDLKSNGSKEGLPLPTLQLASNVSWEEGEQVIFIGNPLSFSLIVNEGRLIDQVGYVDRNLETLVLDAPVYRGNSGSPVINKVGQVIGVIFAKSEFTYDQKKIKVGLAIPTSYLHDLLSQVENLEVSN